MSQTTDATEPTGIGRERLAILAGLVVGMLLGAIDQSIVGTALPTIAGDLGGIDQLSWVVTAYLVTVTVTTPIYGKLSDLYGRKLIYEVSIAIFLVGSALSGLSQSMLELALFRGLQGIGGGGLIAMATTILGDIFSPRERGRYMSYLMVVFGAATIGGPLLGGWLTDNASWRWIFYINLPLGALAILITHATLDLPLPEATPEIDYPGAALLVGAVSALLLVTTWGGTTYPWLSIQILGLAGVTVVLGVGFVLQERRASDPLFPLHLLRNPTVSGINLVSLCIGAGMFGATIYLPVFLQTVLGVSATNSGVLLFPLVAGLLVTSAASGQLMTYSGRYKPFAVIGLALAAVGYYLLSTMGPATTHLASVAYMFVLGAGLGFVNPVIIVSVQNAVDRANLGVATTSVTFSRSLGSAVGVAAFGALLTTQLSTRLADAVPGAAGGATSTATISPDAIAALPPGMRTVVVDAVANSIDVIFLAGMVISVVAFAIALFLPAGRLRETVNVTVGHGNLEVPETAVNQPAHGDD